MILGIDTSSTELSIGLISSGKPQISYSRLIRHSHAEHIAHAVTFVLQEAGVTVGEVSRIAVAVGPGSFTGLRIGIAFVKGLILDRQIPVLGVSSLECVAQAFPILSGNIAVVADARQDKVYAARFKKESGICQRLQEDRLYSLKEMVNCPCPGDLVVVDTMGFFTSTVADFFADLDLVYTTDRFALQRGLACANIAGSISVDDSRWGSSSEILPKYLQNTYADPCS